MPTLFFGLAGAIVGLIGWALCGLGMAEFGILERFDPMGVSTDAAPPNALVSIVEWSFPVWVLLGSVLLPKLARWAVRTPAEIEADR